MFPSVRDFAVDGLRVLSPHLGQIPASRNELSTIRKYVKFDAHARGESALLLSNYDGFDIPGFDGIIFGPGGDAIANVSLKYSAQPVIAIERAIVKARKFSFGAGWAEVQLNRWGGALIDTLVRWHEFRESLLRQVRLASAFGVAPTPGVMPRRTRIIIEMQPIGKGFWRTHESAFRRLANQDPEIIESISIIVAQDVRTYHPSH